MKIKMKLSLLVSFLLLCILVTGSLSIYHQNQTEEAMKKVEENQTLQQTLKSIQYRFTGISNDERGFLVTGDEEFVEGINNKIEDIELYFEELDQLKLNKEDTKKVQEIQDNLHTYF